jgi:protein phosphatase methylesterase 1
MGLNARIVDLPNKLYASSLSHQIGSRMTTRPGGEDSLRSSLLRSRIAKLPHLPAIAPSSHPYNHQTSGDGEEEENDELGSLSMAAPPPRSASQRQAKTSNLTPLYSPLSANDCFDSALEVDVGDEEGEGSVMKAEQNDSHLASSSDSSGRTKKATFRVYYTPAKPQAASKIDTMSHLNAVDQVKPPSLHSWRPDQDNDGSADELDADTEGHQSDTFFFFHHGAGYSALSYALVAKHITESSNRRAGIIAFDCRGHGKCMCTDVRLCRHANLTVCLHYFE